MKTFETLFAELTEKAETRPAGSGTVAQLDAGVHAIGKKVVEEAAEVWMAAEYQSDSETAEEISPAPVPPAGPDGRQGTDPRGRVHASVAHTQIRRTPQRGTNHMLRIAVPNKGALSGPASEMLREAGYRQRRDTRELVLADPENDVEFFFLRPRDVAVYVGTGTVDVGITGRDLMLDSGADAVEHLGLGFARSTFRYAAPVVPGESAPVTQVSDIAGRRVASSYTTLVAQHLAKQGVEPAAIVHLDGAVESSVRLGVADVIADVVETGTTLRAAGLEVFGEPILRSEAVLIRQSDAEPPSAWTS